MTHAKKEWRTPRVQYAALPFRLTPEGETEIMLVTSRETRRWVIPKGWPMKGLKPHAAAAREAFEEAGLVGKVGKRAIGVYRYEKRLKQGTSVACDVTVFPFEVKQQRKRWPEQNQRDGRWFGREAAAEAVDEPDLGALIRGFDPARDWRDGLSETAPAEPPETVSATPRASR